MTIFPRLLFAFLFFGCFSGLFSQNLSISFQNPDALAVCGADEFSVTLKNTTANPVTGLLVAVVLPNGMEYAAGSVVGATESNIINLSAPIFAVADLAAGAEKTFSITQKARCSMIAAINSGQQFSNTISASYVGGSQMATTQFYKVETGLLFVVSVNPVTQSGKNGDVLMRTITVRNTRQGPIGELQFSDQHYPGLEIELVGVSGQNSAVLFEANVPGSYFMAFGDGDNLLEFNEIITFTEKITIKDCGIPSYSNPSVIRAAWGCEGDVCQSDTATAEITILPSAANPELVFTPIYSAPVSQCGSEPATQEFLVVNVGATLAEGISVTLGSADPTVLGLSLNSFQINDGTGWSSLTTVSGVPTTLFFCGITNFHGQAFANLPPLAPGDTLRVRFDAYNCQAPCEGSNVPLYGAYSYDNTCPEATTTTGSFVFLPDLEALAIASRIYFDIGVCIEDNAVYNFTYWVKSQRLLNSTDFLHLKLELPWGLFWENTCVPTLDGKTSVLAEVDTVPNTQTVLHFVFQLPMTQDSVFGDFCLRNICQPTSFYQPAVPALPPSGLDYTAYPVDTSCSPCIQKVKATTYLTTVPDVSAECGISVCDEYELVLNCGCGDNSCVGCSGISSILATYDSWRTNVGLRDNNNDRTADNANPANSPLIRRDRFLPGDTMRTQMRGVVITGEVASVSFRLFNESWQSDFGLDGGDPYLVSVGKNYLVNGDSLIYLDGQVILKIASTSQQFTCPINSPAALSDKHYIKIAETNIRPPQIIDELTSMFHQFEISIPELANLGCVPADLLLQIGDSVIFTADFKFRQNFTPYSPSSEPPLINFRNTVCGTPNPFAWRLNGCFPPLLRQYSGYKERILKPVYRIEPCGNSTEFSPFRYSMRIARGNLFPYEVRRLSQILDFRHTLPSGLPLLQTQLNYVRMQENIPIFGSQILTPGFQDNKLTLDFKPFFDNPLDEGFSLESSMQFGPSCAFEGPQNAFTIVKIGYFSKDFHRPDPYTPQYDNFYGYIDGKPDLELVPEDSIIFIGNSKLEFDFFLKNISPSLAPNVWLTWETNGDLTGVEILLLPQQQVVSGAGGMFQLGEIQSFSDLSLRLIGNLKTCEPVRITLRYGWGCAPISNPESGPCGIFEKTVEIRPSFPELELVIVNQPEEVPFCAPSDIFEIEIYNANEGVAFGVIGSVKLPPGLTIIPGSSRLSYPAGSPYIALADPTVNLSNVYAWTPEAVSGALAQNGLQSIEKEPENALRIRFRVQAECGFVANSQPIYGSEAVLPCGIASNVLRKPGNPIQLEGYGPSYDITANLAYANAQPGSDCGEIAELTATLRLEGLPHPSDSIYILLPEGVTYVGGSYEPGLNAPPGPPKISGSVLQLPFPAGLSIDSTVQFNFSLRYDDPVSCDDKSVVLQAREKFQVFCPTIGKDCDVYVATGEAILFLNVQNPDLVLQNFELTLNDNELSFTANLSNAGTGAANNPVVQFYIDQNGNGKVDAGEPLVTSLSPGQTVLPGGNLPFAGDLNLPVSALCQLLAFIPGKENCACADKTFPLNNKPIVHSAVGMCEIMNVPLGVDSVTGSTYTWLTPDGLSCADCAKATYVPGTNVQPGSTVTLVLEEKTANCTIEYRFDIQFGGELGMETTDQIICEGESVKLEATPGGTYQWSGPGLSNPTSNIQIVQPTQTSTYSVTVTFVGGCTGIGQSEITILEGDSVDLGTIATCPGAPVDVFGMPTDQPGLYVQNYQGFNGCDSVVFVRLKLIPTKTTEMRSICPGNSTIVFDSVFTTAGNLCRTFDSSADCDSTHCVTVEMLPDPILPMVQDSFVVGVGEEIQLDGPDGYVSYTWTPATGLNCTNCADPVAKPDSSTTYLLTVVDTNGCDAAATYRVLLCDFEGLDLPNAFTPNNDAVNDAFRIVPTESLVEIQTLTIFNRWGEKIWEGSGINARWDGTIDGKPAPSDVYVWLISGGCGREIRERKGDVALLR